MRRRFIVQTHVGNIPTWATSAKKAISNVRFRLFGRQPADWHCRYWTAREAAS